MIGQQAHNALKLRALAAQFRAHADQTCVHLFRRKFDSVASELEEAALDAETRAWAHDELKRVS